MKWALYVDRQAMRSLYNVPREFVPLVTAALDSLTLNPWQEITQPDEDNPSRYWIPVAGDFVILYEIIDERHVVKILDIE